ncbi:hypothetical protein [Leeuwenhoekiella aestuarii]|uniref:hypothetical protein n=1 Tax=Leeuwenhoekiella aestuarii TaxID=2249426 RepID=UPI0013757226|nr:hypothetical protein [Leeuwenhoekiella aestuarii]
MSSFVTYSQVGIGITNPEAALHINGDMLIQKELIRSQIDEVTATDEEFKLLTRLTNSTPIGEVTYLDPDDLTVAPINIVNYRFFNINSDNLENVNLQYDTSKYVIAISNFQYIGDGIDKGPSNSIGAFVTRVFQENNTWHLEIRNRFLDLADTKSVEYRLTLIVYDKSYYKELPTIRVDLKGNNTGSTTAPENLN